MKKKKNKIQEPQYVCCSAYYNYCGETVRKYLVLNKSELMKRLNNGERFEYVFNASGAVKVNVQVDLEEEKNDNRTI